MTTPSYAERAIRLLEDQLRTHPPAGVSDEQLVHFFAQHRPQLLREMEAQISKVTGRQGLVLVLRADPNPDFDPGTHQATLTILPQWVRVASLSEAQQRAMAFRDAHHLGGGNWTGGEVFRDGTPYARISYNGRIWDAILGGEFDADGRPIPVPDRSQEQAPVASKGRRRR